jgi:hypothetical protein
MNLHLDKYNFEGAIVAAADYFEIPEIFIEKDYQIQFEVLFIVLWSRLYYYKIFTRPKRTIFYNESVF